MIIQTISLGFSFWLGFYLLARDITNSKLRYTGLGLICYTVALTFDLLAHLSISNALIEWFLRLHWGVLLFPSIFWMGTVLHLNDEPSPPLQGWRNIWQWGILPVSLIIAILFPAASLFWNFEQATPNTAGYLVTAIVGTLPLWTAVWIVPGEIRRSRSKHVGKRRAIGLVLAAALFFALGAGLALLQWVWLPHLWAILAVGLDLEILGFAIAYLDAFEQGESFFPDFLRSFATSVVAGLLFSGQVAFVIALSTGVTLPMTLLLLASLAFAILTQIYSDALQKFLDQLVFARLPRVREERAALRAVAGALPRTTTLNPLDLEEETFTRHTRRALSHFGDLPKLASNPLTQLPLIEKRLQARDASPNTLERAAELKTILAESVARLKPPTDPFGTTDAWRFYNAVYYPYILGLRPYSHRTGQAPLDQETQTLLTWFRTTVPERTLHNWQNAAAALIARDLREQNTP